jgi:hypothetical protein
LRHCATSWKVAGSISGGSLEFFIDLILLAALCPWGFLPASNRKENQGSSLGGTGDWCAGLSILLPSFADCVEILGATTSWAPMGASRPVIGIALPFYLIGC